MEERTMTLLAMPRVVGDAVTVCGDNSLKPSSTLHLLDTIYGRHYCGSKAMYICGPVSVYVLLLGGSVADNTTARSDRRLNALSPTRLVALGRYPLRQTSRGGLPCQVESMIFAEC